MNIVCLKPPIIEPCRVAALQKMRCHKKNIFYTEVRVCEEKSVNADLL